MKMGLRILFVLGFCVSGLSMAYIYEITTMHKGKSGTVVGLSDFHDKANVANAIQLQILENAILGYDPRAIHCIVEDLSSRNTQGRMACGSYFVNSRGGILGGLAEKMQRQGLGVDNIEFRYCRVTSLGPVLNNVQVPLEKLVSVTGTKLQQLMDEVEYTIAEVEAYNDDPILKKTYQSAIKQVRDEMKKLQWVTPGNQTVAEYIAKHSTPATRVALLKKLLTFDSALLDVKMIHAIVQRQQNTKKTVVVAGGSHIVRVCEWLEKIGYKKARNTSVAYAKEYNVQRCLGSHIIEGSYCVKPQPVESKKLSDAL